MNNNRLIENFDSNFISNLINLYNQYVDFLNENHPIDLYKNDWAIPWFRQFGKMKNVYTPFYERNKENLNDVIFEHFKNTLYYPNIYLLDYILEEYDTFKNLKFLDFACGIGSLSIFLKKININCFNYDTNTEIGFSKLSYEEYKDFLFTSFFNKKSKVRVESIKDKIDSEYDCIVCMGYYFDSSLLNSNCKYIFLDSIYNEDYLTTTKFQNSDLNFELIHNSSQIIILKKII